MGWIIHLLYWIGIIIVFGFFERLYNNVKEIKGDNKELRRLIYKIHNKMNIEDS
jgi:hypothetical protein